MLNSYVDDLDDDLPPPPPPPTFVTPYATINTNNNINNNKQESSRSDLLAELANAHNNLKLTTVPTVQKLEEVVPQMEIVSKITKQGSKQVAEHKVIFLFFYFFNFFKYFYYF